MHWASKFSFYFLFASLSFFSSPFSVGCFVTQAHTCGTGALLLVSAAMRVGLCALAVAVLAAVGNAQTGEFCPQVYAIVLTPHTPASQQARYRAMHALLLMSSLVLVLRDMQLLPFLCSVGPSSNGVVLV